MLPNLSGLRLAGPPRCRPCVPTDTVLEYIDKYQLLENGAKGSLLTEECREGNEDCDDSKKVVVDPVTFDEFTPGREVMILGCGHAFRKTTVENFNNDRRRPACPFLRIHGGVGSDGNYYLTEQEKREIDWVSPNSPVDAPSDDEDDFADDSYLREEDPNAPWVAAIQNYEFNQARATLEEKEIAEGQSLYDDVRYIEDQLMEDIDFDMFEDQEVTRDDWGFYMKAYLSTVKKYAYALTDENGGWRGDTEEVEFGAYKDAHNEMVFHLHEYRKLHAPVRGLSTEDTANSYTDMLTRIFELLLPTIRRSLEPGSAKLQASANPFESIVEMRPDTHEQLTAEGMEEPFEWAQQKFSVSFDIGRLRNAYDFMGSDFIRGALENGLLKQDRVVQAMGFARNWRWAVWLFVLKHSVYQGFEEGGKNLQEAYRNFVKAHNAALKFFNGSWRFEATPLKDQTLEAMFNAYSTLSDLNRKAEFLRHSLANGYEMGVDYVIRFKLSDRMGRDEQQWWGGVAVPGLE